VSAEEPAMLGENTVKKACVRSQAKCGGKFGMGSKWIEALGKMPGNRLSGHIHESLEILTVNTTARKL
jgi:hypothetical protein